jgi:hypothetical protein
MRGLPLVLVGASLASCVLPPPGPPPPYPGPQVSVAVGPGPGAAWVAPAPGVVVGAYPVGARPYWYHGVRCWRYRGAYYRPHPRGYVVFHP